MKKKYMAPKVEVFKMEIEKMVCDSMKVGSGSIGSGTPGLEVGAPGRGDFEDFESQFDFSNGLKLW